MGCGAANLCAALGMACASKRRRMFDLVAGWTELCEGAAQSSAAGSGGIADKQRPVCFSGGIDGASGRFASQGTCRTGACGGAEYAGSRRAPAGCAVAGGTGGRPGGPLLRRAVALERTAPNPLLRCGTMSAWPRIMPERASRPGASDGMGAARLRAEGLCRRGIWSAGPARGRTDCRTRDLPAEAGNGERVCLPVSGR